jgi:hypothetical protein
MSQLPPNLSPRSGPPDDLDRVLGRFFKAQVPQPFPTLRLPEPSRPAPARVLASGDTGYRSRLTLAVSAALLLGGGLYLSGQFAPAPHPGIGDKATATGEKGPLGEIRKVRAEKANDPAEGFVPGPVTLP